jgi:hypothetical protein
MLGFSWMPAWLLAVAEPGILEAVLESNLVNIAIILTLLYLLGRRVVGEALAKRRESILEELRAGGAAQAGSPREAGGGTAKAGTGPAGSRAHSPSGGS